MKGLSGTEGVRADEQLLGPELFALPSLAAAAHELKAPLALIRNLSQALEHGNYSADEVELLAKRIRLTSERSLRLVSDIALTERLDDMLVQLEPINPVSFAEEVAHELSPLFAARGRTLRVQHHRRPPIVVANRTLMRSVLLQFADNALHYADEAPVEFVTRASRGGEQVRVGVRDYGPALSADVWRRLRQLGRTPQPVDRRPQSSGLGLYVARQFAEAMQADIGMTRHRDGASFYLQLPGSTQTSWL